jgi:hypothetical protein
MSAYVKGFGCRPLEGRRVVFGGRRPKPFTEVPLCRVRNRTQRGVATFAVSHRFLVDPINGNRRRRRRGRKRFPHGPPHRGQGQNPA